MTKKLGIFLLIILAIGAGTIYLGLHWLKEAAYESCVLSIEDAFGQAISHDSDLSRQIPVTDVWRTLSDTEERILFEKFIALGRRFDCTQFDEYANGKVFLGEYGKMQVRQRGESVRVRFVIKDGRTRVYNPNKA
ncbi:MAG: hypothetical protein HOP17_02755 [Acidobacteria bacterium]|nr:hypothetical protein [Acidobacteriota bacterium]